jgi:FdrA protein
MAEIRSGVYYDSVSLMQVSRKVSTVPGVDAALIAMATQLNVELLVGMGFDVPDGAAPNDLIVAIRAVDDAALDAAATALEGALAALTAARPGTESRADKPPRTTRSAARRSGGNLALISVPGQHAFPEAMDALEAGLDVMIFSDNVPVAQELALKREAARRGRLVMGPDCGTAFVSGVGLGFANAVRASSTGRGVGIVAASGTGAQQLSCLLDHAGIRVSHILGVGGRDISSDIGALSTLQALRLLDSDPSTSHVVVVSKPPAQEVADVVVSAGVHLSKPVSYAFLGRGQADLTQLAEQVIQAVAGTPPAWPVWRSPEPQAPRQGFLRGLFAGGTLADEAMVIAADAFDGSPILSNIPLRPDWVLPVDLQASGHIVIDFGDDALTQGRAHPMIDPMLRLERLAAEAKDPGTAVVLMDVVLGFGADPDPAASLAPAIHAARTVTEGDGRDLAVVVSLCGTSADPQGLERQADALATAGATVHLSNAAATRYAVGLIEGR